MVMLPRCHHYLPKGSQMIIHQVGKKLRQQIHNFSGELCWDFGKFQGRFVEEILFGLSSNGSVRLTEIARSFNGTNFSPRNS